MSDKPEKHDATASARALRRMRAKLMLLKFGIFVGAPTLIAILYYGLVASDVYQSTSSFTVQTAENRPVLGLETIVGGMTGSVSTRDALAVQQFILSREMLAKLDEEHQLRAHYSNTDADWWSRLDADDSNEEAFEYYLDQVTINYETLSGLLTMELRAFSAETANALSISILKHSEAMVNRLSERARLDQINYAKQEVAEAEKRLSSAQQAVIKLQSSSAEFHPEKQAATLLSVKGQLEVELAQTRANLSQAQAVMRPDAPKVVSLRQKIAALNKQITRENKRLLGEMGEGLGQSMAAFESAMMEKEFAQQEYQSAMASLEMAKMEAARQSRYLTTIAPPSLPDEATHPKRGLGILTAFLIALAVFGIGSLLIAAVREHARI